MSVINATPLLAAAGGDYQISRSVRLRSSASGYFTRTPSSASGQQTFTISAWVKRGTLSTQQVVFGINSASTNIFTLSFLAGDTLRVFGRNAGSDVLNLTTTAVYRDPSAWYHIIIAIDTTQATSSNRARMYVNGVEVAAFGTATYPAQNTSLAWNSNSYAHDIGRESTGNYFDGYTTEINHISGTQLTPSSFGETDSITGVWKPKKYAGTYGTNGFYLNFSDNSAATAAAIGKDYSGNGNNWTPNNISVTAGVTYDSMLDVPTLYADGGNGRGNYATLNPLSWRFGVGQGTFSEGNLRFTYSGGSSAFAFSTIGVSSGKWYFEATITAIGSSGASVGISDLQAQWGTFTNRFVYNSDGSHTGAGGTWATYTTNDVIGVAYDLDTSSVSFYKNNTLQGSVTLNAGVTYHLEIDAVLNSVYSVNFGQRPFSYTPPTGFKALNTQNLPEPTIKKGNQYFDVSLYTGNGTSTGNTQVITNSGSMQPDFVWIKARNSATPFHILNDSVRGANKILYSNSTDVENSVSNVFNSFNSNGFTVDYNSSFSQTVTNANGQTYVGWQWKESPSAGFDIVTYTGTGSARTVSHSLGVAPAMMIVKNRSAAVSWDVYHQSLGATKALFLNLTNAQYTGPEPWNNTAPTSSVFSVGTGNDTNGNGNNLVAYLFAEVAGFSKFGSYTGNGSADGPFVFCGFRPRWVLIKNASASEQWYLVDTARDLSNPSGLHLYPNLSNAEFSPASSFPIDILSNGFKVRTASAGWSTNGQTYIYACFAENPFKNSLAR